MRACAEHPALCNDAVQHGRPFGALALNNGHKGVEAAWIDNFIASFELDNDVIGEWNAVENYACVRARHGTTGEARHVWKGRDPLRERYFDVLRSSGCKCDVGPSGTDGRRKGALIGERRCGRGTRRLIAARCREDAQARELNVAFGTPFQAICVCP